MPTFNAIPFELRQYKNWILWKYEDKGGKKPTKVPYQKNGNHASVNNPSTWCSFDDAISLHNSGLYDGIGFVFTNTPYSGIDLDDCSTLEDGTPNPNMAIDLNRQIEVFNHFDSYSERSPSGKGLHIIVKGTVASGKKKASIELYSTDRYFTMTGNVYADKPIAEKQDLLTQLWQQMGGDKSILVYAQEGPQEKSDEEIIKIASEAVNGDKFKILFNGDFSGYISQSEADLALMNIIVFYTKNRAQIARIYSQSKLAKTDKKRTTPYYLNRTIDLAFDKSEAQINIEEYAKQLELQLNLGPVAQRLEPIAHNGLVAGSNPAGTTKPAPDFQASHNSGERLPIDKAVSGAGTQIIPPPGLVGDIAKFIYAAAPRPVEEVAIAAAIGLMAGICGRAYNISGTGLNQYIMLIAVTGSGKEAMASGIDRIINAVQLSVPVASEFIGPSRIASGQALYKYLANKSQSFVSIIGEFGKRLEAMSGRNANSAEKQLIAELLDLYNKSGYGQTAKPSIYSDQDKNTLMIQSPAFSILGESTPDTFYGSLNEDMIGDGLLPRFMLIEYTGPRPRLNENHIQVQPDFTLIDTISTLMANAKTTMANRKVINVDRSPDAAKILQEFDELADARINATDKETIRQLWNRAHIKVLKIAALLAVGQNIYSPTVSVDNVLWAKRIVENDIRALSIKFEEGTVGKSSEEIKQVNECKRMLKEFIQPHNWEKIGKYCLDQRFYSSGIVPYQYLNKRLSAMACYQHDKSGATISLKRAIQTLIDSGIIAEVSKQQLIDKFGTGQKAYVITNINILL